MYNVLRTPRTCELVSQDMYTHGCGYTGLDRQMNRRKVVSITHRRLQGTLSLIRRQTAGPVHTPAENYTLCSACKECMHLATYKGLGQLTCNWPGRIDIYMYAPRHYVYMLAT